MVMESRTTVKPILNPNQHSPTVSFDLRLKSCTLAFPQDQKPFIRWPSKIFNRPFKMFIILLSGKEMVRINYLISTYIDSFLTPNYNPTETLKQINISTRFPLPYNLLTMCLCHLRRLRIWRRVPYSALLNHPEARVNAWSSPLIRTTTSLHLNNSPPLV